MSLCAIPFRIFYAPADDLLNNFYIPALSASVRYDRSAGFFSSSALAVAATGVARLIHNGGQMRLLVGAALDENDVKAIQQGYDLKTHLAEKLLERFSEPQEALLRQRLEVLAWMVAAGTLEIRVVLPRDEHGLPLPAHLSQDYYHPKSGIFTDAQGNQIAFSGSVNESATAWLKNYETFSVYFSWNETKPYLAQVTANFENLWQGKEKDWTALDIPQAVRQKLLQYKPAQAPQRDPLEAEPLPAIRDSGDAAFVTGRARQAERILFQFVRDAPYLVNAGGLGAATAAITPYPHQTRVAGKILGDFPAAAMLCDEVGLGKTIEAGLVIRQLMLSGRVRRCLILAPKSVLKQWQEELYEKFALEAPRFDGKNFWGLNDAPLSPENGGNPWDAYPLLLAGSQLAKRADRREQILAAQGWDLVAVDEAHHARRKDFAETSSGQRLYRPNRLLGLLNELNSQGKTASLLLMTATPMQVHPLEVWDLLKLLGMGGRWGADEDNFLEFFAELRKPFDQADWDFLFDMLGDELQTGGHLDDAFCQQAGEELGLVKWSLLEALPAQRSGRKQTLAQLGTVARPFVQVMARRHTPLRRYIFRNTRELLRQYHRLGLLKDNVSTRKPRLVRVPMRPEEYALYERIEEYISHFYHKYENERRGLGFVMTVYRRRLTSSFYAVRCSLERRLKFLRGQLHSAFDDDDTEQDELSLDIGETVSEDSPSDAERRGFADELAYVQDFLHGLVGLSAADSKLERLLDELNTIFRQRSKALIFTQYTDTLDYLRDQLVCAYGSEVACYSGRGGETWNGIAWVLTSKESVKADFKAGKVRILLCTDSASEGLNLQTCGVLINYDMPWNPMRVEQRIGRIDRIGQEYKEVWISNYFYQDTIEDLIYQRLADRINWFEVVVGDLQPILAEVGEATRRLAMLSGAERQARLEKEIEALRQRLQNREMESLNLDSFADEDENPQAAAAEMQSPLTLADLEQLLTRASATASLFHPHPQISAAYSLDWNGQALPVTFSPACFDDNSDSVRLLTYGSPLLAEILESVPPPEIAAPGSVVRFCSDSAVDRRGWYQGSGEHPRLVETLPALRHLLENPTAPEMFTEEALQEAGQQFAQSVENYIEHERQVIAHRHKARQLAERARAQRLLVKAALVEIALGQQQELWDDGSYPLAFSEKAILGLQRHGFPWGALLQLVYEEGLVVHEQDSFYQQIRGSTRDSLKGRFAQLTEEAKRMVKVVSSLP